MDIWEHIYALFLKLICSSFSDRLCTFLKISNFLNQIKCSCTVFPWFPFQKKSEIFPCNLWRPYLAGFCGNVETTFRQPSSKIAISLHSPQPLTVMVATGQGLKEKKSPEKSEIWEICAGMAQNYHLSSLCRNPRGRGHLVSANQGELSLGLVALLTTTDKKGKFRNVQTWEITTSENLNRNTFAPATIPPALKRSLANIHTHVLACADKN